MRKLMVVGGLLGYAWLASACVVAGYSSRGGWFVWPSGIFLLLGLLLVVLWIFRRR